jgi:hypothetical protein
MMIGGRCLKIIIIVRCDDVSNPQSPATDRRIHSFIAAFIVVTAAFSGGSSFWITFQITWSEMA